MSAINSFPKRSSLRIPTPLTLNLSFNTLIDWNSCSPEQQRALLTRPAISASDSITRTVSDILDNV
ncbi:hypothetical protein MJI37_32025, partial [Salmonella enterica subsp. enterica serovar Cerro]|nr:hypothetical protein [Salmonella enterica subsp. enterica serovar Cerro]